MSRIRHVLFVGCVGLMLNGLGCGAGPDKGGEETPGAAATGVRAGQMSQSLGVVRWDFPQSGVIVGVSELGKVAVTFEGADHSKLRGALLNGSEKLIDPKAAQSDVPADSIDKLHRALVADMKAEYERASADRTTENGDLGTKTQASTSYIAACCNGYGPTSSAQITKWYGPPYQGWCHIDYTGYACYGYNYCWDVAGDCYTWY